MPMYSPMQSDVEVAPVEPLSEEEVQAKQAGSTVTRWVMGVTFFMLLALVVLCAIGPHIPTGE